MQQVNQREEKQLDSSLEGLLQRVTDLRNSITAFQFKLETQYETLNWPTVLDNFALISSNVSSLNRLLKSDKCPVFRNYALLPLVLNPDRDPQIEKLTEGRVFAFNHEVVPDYLRTKPEPEVEERVAYLQSRGFTGENLNKQVNQLNKVTNNVLDMVNSIRDEWESEVNQKAQQPQTSSQAETNLLVSAVTLGKGLKSKRMDAGDRGTSGQSGGQTADQRTSQAPTPNVHINKAPSAIKTNIRPGGAHPYARQ